METNKVRCGTRRCKFIVYLRMPAKGNRCSLYSYFHYAASLEFALYRVTLYRARFDKNSDAMKTQRINSRKDLNVRGRSILFESREKRFPSRKIYIPWQEGFNRDTLHDSIIFTGFVNGSVWEYRAAGLASHNPSSHEGQ